MRIERRAETGDRASLREKGLTRDFYDAKTDRYCYPGTSVLKNRLGIRGQNELDEFEALSLALRSEEPLPSGRFTPAHYRAVHRHLFQDVYPWAGRYRTVRIAKNQSMFCYPENIAPEMRTLFARLRADNFLRGLESDRFVAKSSEFLACLNAIHPFREGNGRTQLTFMAMLAARAGHPIDLTLLNPQRFLHAMIESFVGDEGPLREQLQHLLVE